MLKYLQLILLLLVLLLLPISLLSQVEGVYIAKLTHPNAGQNAPSIATVTGGSNIQIEAQVTYLSQYYGAYDAPGIILDITESSTGTNVKNMANTKGVR